MLGSLMYMISLSTSAMVVAEGILQLDKFKSGYPPDLLGLAATNSGIFRAFIAGFFMYSGNNHITTLSCPGSLCPEN